MSVARHGCLRAADSKNVIGKAHCVENDGSIQDNEQVCCDVLYQLQSNIVSRFLVQIVSVVMLE